MSRSDHTLPTDLYELDLLDRFKLPVFEYDWDEWPEPRLAWQRATGRIIQTRTRRAGSFKHRERRRWWHAERQRIRQDLKEGVEPARTLTRMTVRNDLW